MLDPMPKELVIQFLLTQIPNKARTRALRMESAPKKAHPAIQIISQPGNPA